MTVKKQGQGYQSLHDGGITYERFIDGLRSPATKRVYDIAFRRYLNHHKYKSADDLLVRRDPRYIESQIIDYIMSLRDSGVAYATIQGLIAPIKTFYQINDVVLNTKKFSRYLGEYRRVVKDKAYSTEQIQQMLVNADIRMRCIILTLSSTGCRMGALPTLVLGNLTKLPEHGLYRITFYEGTKSEYYTFCTRECAATGIDNYLLYRQRCGEKITFDEKMNRWEPEDTPLIREQFDVKDMLQIRHPRSMTNSGLRIAIESHLIRSGIREVEHLIAPISPRRVRKPVSLTDGFRKHVISTFIEAGLNHEIRELLSDHATMLDQNYFRPSEQQVLNEYLKAEQYLTTDDSLRLKQENQTLKIEKSKMDQLEQRMEEYDRVLAQFTDKK